jgi:hypothetical protein
LDLGALAVKPLLHCVCEMKNLPQFECNPFHRNKQMSFLLNAAKNVAKKLSPRSSRSTNDDEQHHDEKHSDEHADLESVSFLTLNVLLDNDLQRYDRILQLIHDRDAGSSRFVFAQFLHKCTFV